MLMTITITITITRTMIHPGTLEVRGRLAIVSDDRGTGATWGRTRGLETRPRIRSFALANFTRVSSCILLIAQIEKVYSPISMQWKKIYAREPDLRNPVSDTQLRIRTVFSILSFTSLVKGSYADILGLSRIPLRWKENVCKGGSCLF